MATFTTVHDLRAHIEALCGELVYLPAVTAMADRAWLAGVRDEDALARRWPADERFWRAYFRARRDAVTRPENLRAIRAEAVKAGDDLQAALCCVALGDSRADLLPHERAALAGSKLRRIRSAGALAAVIASV